MKVSLIAVFGFIRKPRVAGPRACGHQRRQGARAACQKRDLAMALVALLLAAEGLYDTSRELLFVHVPKGGGSAIETTLYAYDDDSIVLPCGWDGTDCDGGSERLRAVCEADVPALRTADPMRSGETMFSLLWENQAHLTDMMAR